MSRTLKLVVMGVVLAFAGMAQAADLYVPPQPQPPEIVYREVSYGGWYLRGDLNYHWSKLRDTEYITYGCCAPDPGTDDFDTTDLKGAFSLGAGIGYKVNSYFRTDLTADYWFDADFTGTSSGTCGGVPCTSTDTTSYSALLLLANAYVDLGTYQGITPYLGAGIGGAYVMWDDLVNDATPGVSTHSGVSSWRFAWALMAGASYCLTDNLDLDVGYRFTHIDGGRMFEESGVGVGPGFDDGIEAHEVRAGLRYTFGGTGGSCGQPQLVAYEPPPMYETPVYK
jgi:opacity protein-like surface antigen